MSPHQVGLIIFITIVLAFFYTWETRNFVTAVVICSVLASVGVLLLPNFTLTTFYMVIRGDIYRFELTMTTVKLTMIVILLFNVLLYKYKGSHILNRWNIDLKRGARID